MYNFYSQSSSDSEDERVVSSYHTEMKREIAQMMRVESKLGWFRACTSSQTGEVKNVEMFALDGDEAADSDVAKVETNGAYNLSRLQIEKVDVDSTEGNISHLLFTPSPHIGGETIGEGTSSEKLHDEEAKLGLNEVVEMKVSQKVESKKNPTRLRDLLETGWLEGLHVRYIHGSKMKQTKSELEGVIQGTGVLCSCGKCKGKMVVTPSNFEMHENSRNKRPAEYIYLENGKSLGDIVKACKVEPSDSLEMVIQNAIGGFCRNCKGLIPEGGAGRLMRLCDKCFVTT